MWIVLTLACALAQSLWMALSKRQLQTLPPLRYMLFLRFPIAVVLVPALFWCDLPCLSAEFWGVVLLTAALECVRVGAIARGTRQDYYATYSLLNTAPLFVLFLAPFVVGERLTPIVATGAAIVIAGGFVFYHAGRFQWAGLVAAASGGAGTTLAKRGLNYGGPVLFMVLLFATSTAMLLAIECVRTGPGPLARQYGQRVLGTVPTSAVNLVAIVTFMFALDLVPVMHFTILFRTSLIFGFVLSLLMLREYERWPAKLAGAVLILAGSLLIALRGGAG